MEIRYGKIDMEISKNKCTRKTILLIGFVLSNIFFKYFIEFLIRS